MKKFVNFFLSLIILAAVALSSTSCLFHYKKYYEYNWTGSSHPYYMQLNFTDSYVGTESYGTLIRDDVKYRFRLSHDDSMTVFAETFDLETYEYVSFFEATAKIKENRLILDITRSSIQELVGEEFDFFKIEHSDLFIDYQYRSADSLFSIDFTRKGESYFEYEGIPYCIYPQTVDTGEYIFFYDHPIDQDAGLKDEGLLFVVTPDSAVDVLVLTVVRSNIENLLGQNFILIKVR